MIQNVLTSRSRFGLNTASILLSNVAMIFAIINDWLLLSATFKKEIANYQCSTMQHKGIKDGIILFKIMQDKKIQCNAIKQQNANTVYQCHHSFIHQFNNFTSDLIFTCTFVNQRDIFSKNVKSNK